MTTYFAQITCEYNRVSEIIYILCNDIYAYKNFYLHHCTLPNRLANQQINSLVKILQFNKDGTLVDKKQKYLKKTCMEVWGVKPRGRRILDGNPEAIARNLLKSDVGEYFLSYFTG